jgi:hypothetical protein
VVDRGSRHAPGEMRGSRAGDGFAESVDNCGDVCLAHAVE